MYNFQFFLSKLIFKLVKFSTESFQDSFDVALMDSNVEIGVKMKKKGRTIQV